MKSNGLLKWLMIPMALAVVFISIRLLSGHSRNEPASPTVASQLTPEEMKALGIEGDMQRDTVATLVAQVKQLSNELQTALTNNKIIRIPYENAKTENDHLRARESAIDQRIQAALDGERNRLQQDRDQVASDRQQTQGLLQDLQKRLDTLDRQRQPDRSAGRPGTLEGSR